MEKHCPGLYSLRREVPALAIQAHDSYSANSVRLKEWCPKKPTMPPCVSKCCSYPEKGFPHCLQAAPVLFRSDQSLSRVRLFAIPWIAARQASLSITNSRSSLRLTSIKSVIPSSPSVEDITKHGWLLIYNWAPQVYCLWTDSSSSLYIWLLLID